jgi:hypothetical protein
MTNIFLRLDEERAGAEAARALAAAAVAHEQQSDMTLSIDAWYDGALV